MQMIIYACLSTGKDQGQYRLKSWLAYIIYLIHSLIICHQSFHSFHSRLHNLKSKELCIIVLLFKKELFSKMISQNNSHEYVVLVDTNEDFDNPNVSYAILLCV